METKTITTNNQIENNLNLIHTALIRLFALDDDQERCIEYMKFNDKIAEMITEVQVEVEEEKRVVA